MGAISFNLDVQLVQELMRHIPLKVFVETGTFHGDSLNAVHDLFVKCLSIELSPEHHAAARRRFAERPNIQLHQGDSGSVLRENRSFFSGQSTLFWLDAHWCAAAGTAGQRSQCPILDELAAIGDLAPDCVIAIDDARLYLSPPPPPHEFADWPSLDEILQALRKLNRHHAIVYFNDVLLFLPQTVAVAIRPYLYRHGYNLLSLADKARDYDAILQQAQTKDVALQEAHDEIEQLSTAAGARGHALEAARTEDATLRAAIAKLTSEGKAKDAELVKLAHEIALLRATSEQRSQALQASSQEAESLRMTASRLQADLQTKETAFQATVGEDASLRAAISSLTSECKAKDAELAKLAQEIALLRETSEQRSQALQASSQEAESLRMTASRLLADLEAKEIALQGGIREASTLRVSAGRLLIDLEAKERVIQDLKQECEQRFNVIEQLDQALKKAANPKPPSLFARLIAPRANSLSPFGQLDFPGKMLKEESKVIFSLESPVSREISSREVVFQGWCYHVDGAIITGIRAKVRHADFGGIHGLPREDVAASYLHAPGTLESGFKIEVEVPKGKSTVHLEACTQSGEWVVFSHKEIFCRPVPWPQRARAWAPFLLTARRDFAKAWSQFPTNEREWLRHRLEQRGLMGLGRFAQHEPRPMTPEKFPRPRLSAARLPKITMVTPSFNQAAYLAGTMDSVLHQRYPQLDYLVLDGGSRDNSAEIIRERASELKYWVSERDRGQSDALCKGFARAECGPDDVMAYLNSDDLLVPGALQYVGEYFARHPEVDAVYGHRIIIDENNQEIGRWVLPRHDEEVLKAVDFIPQETLFWRRRVHDRVGGIDPSFKFAMDWDLLLRLSADGARFQRLPHFLGCFRVHSAQKTSAQINDVGAQEMHMLRLRTFGREFPHDEIRPLIERSQAESGLYALLLAKGLRL